MIGRQEQPQYSDGLRRRTQVSTSIPTSPSAPSQVPLPLLTVPMGDPIIDDEKGWSRLPEAALNARSAAWTFLRHHFSRFSPSELSSMKAQTRQYYTNMYSLIDGLESADVPGDVPTAPRHSIAVPIF